MTISPFKVIQGHRFWFQSKAHTRLPITTIAIAICMQLNAQYLPIGKYCALSCIQNFHLAVKLIQYLYRGRRAVPLQTFTTRPSKLVIVNCP